ncbi:MAG: hypothetical protein LCI00_04745 [Chloroflexi bacterium]|nr:hypothetical protein [Chloroflexota bacterium]MCC6896361.1 hypothetical protein [Anaerolineae bacterium]
MRLTRLDCDVWKYLSSCFEAGTGSPSVSEVAAAVHCGRSAVTEALTKLEFRGIVRWRWLGDGQRRAARGCLTVQVYRDATESEALAAAVQRQAEVEAAAAGLPAWGDKNLTLIDKFVLDDLRHDAANWRGMLERQRAKRMRARR